VSNREQDTGLDSLMKSLQLLTLQGQLFGANRSDAEPRAKELVDLVRLTGAIDRRVGTYSGSSYLGFILPLSIVSSALAGAGLASQNLVRRLNLRAWYAVGMLMGLEPITGIRHQWMVGGDWNCAIIRGWFCRIHGFGRPG